MSPPRDPGCYGERAADWRAAREALEGQGQDERWRDAGDALIVRTGRIRICIHSHRICVLSSSSSYGLACRLPCLVVMPRTRIINAMLYAYIVVISVVV
jgi:hypothetical protein